MRFWLRELVGWLFIAVGIYLFFNVYDMLYNKMFFETIPLTLIGIFVFRAGIQLLKVALAARICMRAQPDVVEKKRPALPAAAQGNRSRTPGVF